MASTNRPQQTERADPLDGAGGAPQVQGTSRTISEAPEIDPGRSLGASSRGTATPAGEDRHPNEASPTNDFAATREGVQNDLKGNEASPTPGAELGDNDLDKEEPNDEETIGGGIGGSGAASRKFSKPSVGDAYDSMTGGMTGQPKAARIFSGRSAGTSNSSMLKKPGPSRDTGTESDGEEDY
jgi:hypothetical protein